MARRKKEDVSVDEVREEITQTPTADEMTEAGLAESSSEEEQATEEGGAAPEALTAEALGVGGAEDPIKIVNDEMLVMVELTEHELVEQARIMIEALDEAQREQESLKAQQSAIKARVDAAREVADEAKALVRRGKEERRVAVQQIHNWADMQVYTRRVDTGEIIGVRPMANYERQMPIPEGGQVEPEADAADEAQADSDPDEIELEYDETDGGELAGVVSGDEAESET